MFVNKLTLIDFLNRSQRASFQTGTAHVCLWATYTCQVNLIQFGPYDHVFSNLEYWLSTQQDGSYLA